jgi:membrane dipeptidase
MDGRERRQSAAMSRRAFLAASAAMAAPGCSVVPTPSAPERAAAGRAALERSGVTIDMHSHAGRLLRRSDAPFEPVAEPMRAGGMSTICLAMVADSPATRVFPDGHIAPVRDPNPGELYAWSRTAFARLHRLIESERLSVVGDLADLDRTRTERPGVIVAAEGADFLEGSVERLEEAYKTHRLRHLQLTHYRVNDLGDIQTEPSVHGGLTDFGAAVVRACNRLGIVIDVAHGPFDLVKRAAATSSKPIVLSHTSLTLRPGLRSRQVNAEHARLVASTGGVVGIWPNEAIYPDLAAMVTGMKRMADAVGIDHVGLGSDMLGLTRGTVFRAYDELPMLAGEMMSAGFSREDIGKVLGGNYRRVFAAVTG